MGRGRRLRAAAGTDSTGAADPGYEASCAVTDSTEHLHSPPPSPLVLPARAAIACHDTAGIRPNEGHGPVEGHPEAAERVGVCIERLRRCRELWSALRKTPRRRATDEELELCHEKSHLAGLQSLARLALKDSKPHFVPAHGPVCLGGPGCEVRESTNGTDTYVTAGSLEAARLSVGGLLELVSAALSADGPTCGLALCRPPGHHASHNRSSGFCLINNIAVAAEYARRHLEVQRVLILDWDVHHGQGTQQIFESSRDVLVVNIHRYDGCNFYPATGGASEVGSGSGKGYTVNVAMPEGYGGAALWAACANVLLPAARRFQPQLILVSAGFDAAAGDPLGGCEVPPAAFGAITQELRHLANELCEGRLILALEGGYHLDILPECVEAVVRALLVDVDPKREPFHEQPAWLTGSACFGAIRRTCEVHHSLALRLPLPASKTARRKGAASVVGDTCAPAGTNGQAHENSEDAMIQSRGGGDGSTSATSHAGASDSSAVGAQAATSQEGAALSPPSTSTNSNAVAAGDTSSEASLTRGLLQIRSGELVLRFAQIPRPTDVFVSEEKVWISHEVQGRGPDATDLQCWRLEGVHASNIEKVRCAEYRRKDRELMLRLDLGPILGGTVELVRDLDTTMPVQ